jgi:hypothetical protein
MNKLQTKLLKEICGLHVIHWINPLNEKKYDKYFEAENKRLRKEISKAMPKLKKEDLNEIIYHTVIEVLK